MDVQKRKRFKILFFLVKPEPENREKGYLKRRKGYAVCFLIFIAVCFVLRGLAVEGPMYIPGNGILHSKWTDSQSINSTLSTEVRHIAFLKVHKTGSSTLQNIFLRYGHKQNLMIVLPTKGNKLLPNIPPLDPLRGKTYDILALHARFNKTVFQSLMPKDTVYIGVVRGPLDVMISSAYYNRDVWHVPYLQQVPREDFIQNLIRFPELYDKSEYSLTKNSMAEVFGFPKGLHVTDKNEIRNYLECLGTIFRLVLITEHFNESLILMRRYLRWKLANILYIPLNEFKHPSFKELNISSVDKDKFTGRNYLDYEVYKFFYERFVNQTSLEDDFLDEVEYFSSLQRRVQLFCLLGNTQGESLRIKSSRWNEPFLVTKFDCDLMTMPELDFIEKLRREHEQALLHEIS